MKWKKLSTKKLFEHPRLSVYEDEVELPNGQKTQYLHFGAAADAAMSIAINKEGKVLIQKEYSYPPDEVLFQLPGGLMNKDESPIDGARRELAEETGLNGDLESLGWFYLHNRRTSQKMHVFVVTNLQEAIADKDPEELFEDYWFTPEEVDHLISTNEIRNYTLLAGWAMYKIKYLQ